MNETTTAVINRLMQIKGITDRELAEKINHTPFARYKKYKADNFEHAPIMFIAKMCRELGVTIDFLEAVSRYQYFEVKGE